MKNPVRILILLLAFGCLAGCALFAGKQDADALFRAKKYTAAIESYRKMLSRPFSAGRDAAARYSIALILAYYDNPQRNYAQALEAFEEFLKLYPDHEKAAEALNWKNTLKLLLEEKRQNEQLKKNIEELKRLDIRHEEKRKGR